MSQSHQLVGSAEDNAWLSRLGARDRRKAIGVLEALELVAGRATERGGIIPQSLVAEVLGVSKQRVAEFLDNGRLQFCTLNGVRFVYRDSFMAFLREGPRKPGRPRSPASAAINAGKHMGYAVADVMDGSESG